MNVVRRILNPEKTNLIDASSYLSFRQQHPKLGNNSEAVVRLRNSRDPLLRSKHSVTEYNQALVASQLQAQRGRPAQIPDKMRLSRESPSKLYQSEAPQKQTQQKLFEKSSFTHPSP